MKDPYQTYYVPDQSAWPIITTLGLFCTAFGAGLWIIYDSPLLITAGFGILVYIFFGWFQKVISESQSGMYSRQLDMSFRLGMGWFIFSEIMFFAAFFGALFYVRTFALPWLNGEGSNEMTNVLLWPEFSAQWPLLLTPAATHATPKELIDPFHLPLVNTILLVTSSLTLTVAHHALKANDRSKLTFWMVVTILFGISFLIVQGVEYVEAYSHLGLTLESGIYGSTFFILTGFHGMHVTLGTIILIVIFLRLTKGHFSSEKHFAFEASAWYWHFVDVVWLGLFIFVYLV